MASSMKIPGKRLNNEMENDSFHLELKRAKFDEQLSDQLSDQDSNIDITSYNTPPPSTVSDSRERSISPNEELNNNNDSPKDQKSKNNNNENNSSHSTSGHSTRDEGPIAKKSDRLLQDDVNYIALCSAASALRSQREMVKRDIIKLRDLKQRALENPDKFIQELGTKKGDIVNSIPKQIHIINGDLNKLFKR